MKKQINHLILFLFLLVVGLSLKAQEEGNTSFSLDQATQYAMQNSYVLFNTKQDVTIAQKQVWETITTGLPQVSATANYSMFLNLPVSLLPGEFFGEDPGTYIPVKFGQDYSADFGFSVSQQIFDGSWIVGVRSAELYLNLAKQANEKTEIDIRSAVAQAYYTVLISERYRTVMLESFENTTQLYEETKVYYENGFREQQDVDQLRILQKNAENEVLRSERELKIAKTVLKYTMGYDLNQEIDLSDKLDVFVSPLVREMNTINLDVFNHIDYRLAQSNFEVSDKLYRLEKVAYLPQFDAFYSYSKTSYGNKANLLKEAWFPSSLIGFQASIPIFNSGNKRAKVQMARIELDKAQNDMRYSEITLQKDYLTASAEMETAREQFLNTRENLDLAQSILDKTHIKFNNGMISSAELSQQESQYITTWQQLITSTMSLLQADLNLKKAAGAL
ncbi:TolC family protein [Draconibacterium halophilum]|uniref:TolC family protein n=1 Tax=Draconibacterium halophilum TaxID=2706887 RepID=A0A6C0R8P0_9BACT|nr:TolC family protein [Draconibacterium halophilum]QIA06670.1 TolC family protein [Draconibacterium halophilum]